MSKAMRSTLIHLSAWLIVGILMSMIFINPDTIKNFGDNKTKTLLLSALIGIGYLSNLVDYRMQKSKRYGYKKDERDFFVQSKATSFSFIIVAIYVYALATGLYTYYEKSKFVPIGWIWFLAYSLIVVAHVSIDVGSIYYYYKQGR